MFSKISLLAVLVATVAAKTDFEGCTSSQTIAFGGASMIYWVPETGEICSNLDCGGGRAPPKTTVPGCPQYAGTLPYTPDYMPGWGEATSTPVVEEVMPTPSESKSEETGYAQGPPASESEAVEYPVITKAPVVSSMPGYMTTSVSMKPTGSGGVGSGTNGTATYTMGKPAEATGAASALTVGAGVMGLAGLLAVVF